MAVGERTPILELKGISKRFGAVQALSEVDFEVYAGEAVGLVGDNGAGKSTLVKTIAGINIPDAGQYIFSGQQVHVAGPTDVTKLGISTVYQDLALCDNLDVVNNLYLGREELVNLVPVLREGAMERRATARWVLVTDPPGAWCGAQTPQVLELIRRLRDQGLAVVVISHNMADVFEVADRIMVMRLGPRLAPSDVTQ